jgi:rSAM/selenodomain-associated transferase 1
MKTCLIIFAKEPEHGRVKTRLIGHMDDNEVLELYKDFVRKTIELVKDVPSDETFLAYDSSGEASFIKSIKGGLSLFRQEGKDLGERMHNAFIYSGKRGNEATIIIGSDSPDMPPEFIKKGFDSLEKSDIVVGPSRDGGYYLVGLKQPDERIFKDVNWSSDKVFFETMNNIKNAGKVASLVDEWYDIDTIQDLEFYNRRKGESR